MKALDAGAMGIICPMVNTRAEAEEYVSYMRYPPLGQRSFGPTSAAIVVPGYGVAANEQVRALAMIATAEGVADLDEIAAAPGLDGIYVGPADLRLGTQQGRLSPGFDREEPEMIEMIRLNAGTCRSAGIRACLHCGTPDYAARAVGRGYDLTTVSCDSHLLAGAAAISVQAFRDQVGGPGEAGQEGRSY